MNDDDVDGLAPGTVVGGRYTVVSRLGQGGMGAVYLATQEPLGREVALKVIAPGLAIDRDAVERFQREAKASSSLSHPNIVTVYDFGRADGRLFIAMELLRGTPGDKLVEQGPLPWRRAITVLRGVCAALAEAHEHGIVHRDLKPANIIVTSTKTQTDVAKVVDFGIAKMKDGGKTLTMTGAVVGTPGYVAPELFDGHEPAPATDLYALGVVAFELLCGRAPFPGRTPMELIKAHVMTAPPSPSLFVSELPPALDALVLALLQKEAAGRPASARAVDDALRAIDQTTTTTTTTPSTTAPAGAGPRPADDNPSKVVIPLTPAQATELATPLPFVGQARDVAAPTPVVVVTAPPELAVVPALTPRRRPPWPVVVLGFLALAVAGRFTGVLGGGSGQDGDDAEREERSPRFEISGRGPDGAAREALHAIGAEVATAIADDVRKTEPNTAAVFDALAVAAGGDVRKTDPQGTQLHDALSLSGDGPTAPTPPTAPIVTPAKVTTSATSTGSSGSGEAGRSRLDLLLAEAKQPHKAALSKEAIASVFRRNMTQQRYCYEKELARDPTLQGRVGLSVTIGASGAVTAASISDTTVNSAALESCLLARVKTWKFPASSGPTTVKYPFVFSSQ